MKDVVVERILQSSQASTVAVARKSQSQQKFALKTYHKKSMTMTICSEVVFLSLRLSESCSPAFAENKRLRHCMCVKPYISHRFLSHKSGDGHRPDINM